MASGAVQGPSDTPAPDAGGGALETLTPDTSSQ